MYFLMQWWSSSTGDPTIKSFNAEVFLMFVSVELSIPFLASQLPLVHIHYNHTGLGSSFISSLLLCFHIFYLDFYNVTISFRYWAGGSTTIQVCLSQLCQTHFRSGAAWRKIYFKEGWTEEIMAYNLNI